MLNINLYKIFRKKYIQILFSSTVLFVLNACSEHSHSHEQDHSSSHQVHEDNNNLVGLSNAQIKTIGLTLGTIEMKELTATIEANGLLKVPNNFKAQAGSLYGGLVKNIFVQVGDNVKKGQAIAQISNPQFVQFQEEYLSIDAKLIFAEQEVVRQKQLSEGGAGALKNLQNAQAELKSLIARKASLESQFGLMGIPIQQIQQHHIQSTLTIKSPIKGVISKVFAQIGSYIDVSSPLAEIVDNSSLHLDLQIFEKDLPLLKVGQIIHFTLTNNPTQEYDAQVFSIGASFENESKTIPVHAEVLSKKDNLIDGMNITGIVSLNNATMPAVPDAAIVEDQGKYYVFCKTDKQVTIENTHQHNDEAHEAMAQKPDVFYERLEIIKGVSAMGFTAINFVKDVPHNAALVTQGAFFLNAKLSNTGAHQH